MYNDDFIINIWYNYYFLLGGGGGYIRYFLDDIEVGVSLNI